MHICSVERLIDENKHFFDQAVCGIYLTSIYLSGKGEIGSFDKGVWLDEWEGRRGWEIWERPFWKMILLNVK